MAARAAVATAFAAWENVPTAAITYRDAGPLLVAHQSVDVDAGNFTQVLGDKGKLVKVVSWYDNEWGYSSRTADLCSILGKM